MLVLTRKTQQQIQIGAHITITILEIKGQSVRVGIEAPRDVTVLRSELAQRLAEEQATSVPAVKRTAPQAAFAPQAAESGTENASSVSCRAPRAALASLIRHPLRTGPASLGHRQTAPLNPRLRRVLSR